MAEFMVKCKDLTPRSRKVGIVVHVVSKEEPKGVRSKRDRVAHQMSEAIVGDDTGVVLMTLWDENVEKISSGKTYLLTNGYITLFRGTMRLNIGKYGEIKEVEKAFEVDAKNNLSEKLHAEPRRASDYDRFSSGSFWPDH